MDGSSPQRADPDRPAERIVIYELHGWQGYLLAALLPDAVRLGAVVGETAGDVLRRLDRDATAFAFHLDLTRSARLPLDRPVLLRRLAGAAVGSINGAVVDISKRLVHRCCRRAGLASAAAPRHGDPDELLIVKTDYNYQGRKERLLTAEQRRRIGYPEIPAQLLADRPFSYRVVARREVGDDIFSSPHLVVERYVTNRDHRFHRIYLAGPSLVVSAVIDASVLKKMPVGIARESYFFDLDQPLEDQPVPARIHRAAVTAARFARAARLDFGALDLVSDDTGGMFVIDVNTTPYWGDGGHPDLLAHLAGGLRRVAARPARAAR